MRLKKIIKQFLKKNYSKVPISIHHQSVKLGKGNA